MIFLFFLLTTWQGPTPSAPCQAHLELQQQGDMLTIIGHCRNLLSTTGRYRYEMALLRESRGGRSQNTQRGEFSVAPQQEISLSQSSVNAGPQDSYRVHLRVFDLEGHTVAQDSAIQIPNR